jgi:Uma2 family endonuclease
MLPDVMPRKFTVAEYTCMAEVGILGRDERVELLDGRIIQMSPIGSRHNAAVSCLVELFVRRLVDTVTVWCQMSLVLDDFSEPEPDVAILRRRADYYEPGLPTSTDVLLMIEVAETSQAYDCGPKARAYARANVPELWVVCLEPDRMMDRIEVFTNPVHGEYGSVQAFRRGDVVTPKSFPHCKVQVTDVLR